MTQSLRNHFSKDLIFYYSTIYIYNNNIKIKYCKNNEDLSLRSIVFIY